jgi:hypothetical protein
MDRKKCGISLKSGGGLLRPFIRQVSYLKGTVSPDIAFYFRVYKFKTVLSVRPLMVFKFLYFIVL